VCRQSPAQGGDDQLGEIVGEIFVREYFGGAAPARMTELISSLERSLERNVSELDWMGPETKQRALAKLKTINHKIGAPQTWRDFSAVRISRDDLVGNARSVRTDDSQRQMRWIGQPVDKNLWLITPQTVNAYYSPPQNEIAFPAGILQPPYFDANKDDAVNFGRSVARSDMSCRTASTIRAASTTRKATSPTGGRPTTTRRSARAPRASRSNTARTPSSAIQS
jgi:predicted metalloendopeptidase